MTHLEKTVISGFYDLGSHTWPISDSPEAQRWFDQGYIWMYGFNHEAAVSCFRNVLELDSGNVFALWGIAYALGPNYNKPWVKFDAVDLKESLGEAHATLSQAMELVDAETSELGRDLVAALSLRYQSAEPQDMETMSSWNAQYADAMRELHQKHRGHIESGTLFADAAMNVKPREFWDPVAEGPVPALEIEKVLLEVIGTPEGALHPGALHLYTHLMEVSPAPEKGLAIGDRLRGLVKDAGHLHHMTTHLDGQAGDYAAVVHWNSRAVVADHEYLAREGGMNFYTLYRIHNIHFKIFGAMMIGQSAIALQAADEMAASLPEQLLRIDVPPMADWLEGSFGMKLHVMIRFGMWEELIREPLPADEQLYAVTTAMTHYAKGLAYAATGRIPEAEHCHERFHEARLHVPPRREVFNTLCSDLLDVAAAMLDGELEYRRGNYELAYAHLRRSIEIDDAIPRREPWGQMQPPRHAYGALLLEQGHVQEAEAVYREDLGLDGRLGRMYQRPNNVWSLHGLHECLRRLGKNDEAAIIEKQFEMASARADVPIKASCACRMTAMV